MSNVTDPATLSQPPTLNLSPPLFVEWAKFPAYSAEARAARIDYVRRELDRAEAAGISPLYVALTLPLVAQQDDAISAIKSRGYPMFRLRLVQGCKPPETDPQGRRIAADKRGKVLIARVGNIPFADPAMRSAVASRGGDIYNTLEIDSNGVVVDLEGAITIMRAWGYGVRAVRPQRPNGPPRRDEWLVVHVRADGTPFAPKDEGDRPARGGRNRDGTQ